MTAAEKAMADFQVKAAELHKKEDALNAAKKEMDARRKALDAEWLDLVKRVPRTHR